MSLMSALVDHCSSMPSKLASCCLHLLQNHPCGFRTACTSLIRTRVCTGVISWPWPYLTPICHTLTFLCHFWAIRTILEPRLPILIPLAPSQASSCLINASQIPWSHPEPACILATHSQTLRLPCVSSTHSQHLYPFLTHCFLDLLFFFCIKTIPDDSSVSRLWLGEAWLCTSLTQCILLRSVLFCPLYICPLSCLLYNPYVSSFVTLHSFLCFIFSSPSSLTLSSPIFIPSLHQPYLAMPYFFYNSFLIIQMNPSTTMAGEPVMILQHYFPYDAQPTLWCAIPAFEELLTAWEAKHDLPNFILYKSAIDCGLQKLAKYYNRFDHKPMYVLALGMLF